MGLFDRFKKKPDSFGKEEISDYSAIDNNEKALDYFNKGLLVKLYLMPIEFGGEDSPMNTLYVPEHANNKKTNFDSKVFDLLSEGLKLGYSARPEYKGSSFIPSKIVIHVGGDKNFAETIDIW